LWQSEDPRYSADSVRIIPGPISVGGITTVDEPVASILGRFEQAALERVRETRDAEGDTAEGVSANSTEAFCELSCAASAEEFIRRSPHISWVGHLMANPAFGTEVGDPFYEITRIGQDESVNSSIWTCTSTPSGTTIRTMESASTRSVTS
jgi:fatty acid synthase, bacteria type